MSFGKEFAWGAATASYQIEGAAYEDGKGKSIWDEFCERDGMVYDGHTGEVACDHYHRFREDVALMKKLGLRAYRFSLSWPRILPDGIGKVNEAGISFYNRLIDALLEAGIEPFITLYHWDLPLVLQEKGGWENPEIKDWFAEYAGVVASRFSDRVKNFITINEPQCVIGLGYGSGIHAPGLKLPQRRVVRAAHNLLCAHGAAVRAMREKGAADIKISYAPTGTGAYPHTETDADREAARQKLFAVPQRWDWALSWFADPVLLGKYPSDGLAVLEQDLPEGWQADMEGISEPLDFLCLNLYNGKEYRMTENGAEEVPRYVGFPHTANNWPVTPEALGFTVQCLDERYHLPIYISENGIACPDVVSLGGKVHDPERIDFTHRYLLELKKAMDAGADVRGYFHWSLMDNFEWQRGYFDRFGLIYVDYRTGERIIKDSGYWYRSVIESDGANL